jgi:hypothetical protein
MKTMRRSMAMWCGLALSPVTLTAESSFHQKSHSEHTFQQGAGE